MKQKVGAALNRESGSARNAIIFFALAMVFRCLGLINRTGTSGSMYTILTEIILPVLFCALMIACILFFGRRFLILTMIPGAICVLFFIARTMSADNIGNMEPEPAERLIRIAVYLLLFMLYSFTVQSEYRFKWVLIPLFFLGIVYHLVFEDYPALFVSEMPLSFSGIMMELSVLFVLLAMLFLCFGFKPKGFTEVTETKKTEAKKPNLLDKLRNIFRKNKNVSSAPESVTNIAEEKKAETVPAGQSSVESAASTEEKKQPQSQAQAQPQVQPQTQTQTQVQSQSQPQTVPQSHPETQSTPEPEAAAPGTFDESFFDKPYRANLTLDPQTEPAENGNSGL